LRREHDQVHNYLEHHIFKLDAIPSDDTELQIATDSIVPLGITFSFNGVSPLVDYEVVFAMIILGFVCVANVTFCGPI
jgi:hypothetical protein